MYCSMGHLIQCLYRTLYNSGVAGLRFCGTELDCFQSIPLNVILNLIFTIT